MLLPFGGRKHERLRKSRLTSLLISPPKQSSPSRTRGCWPSCASRSSNDGYRRRA